VPVDKLKFDSGFVFVSFSDPFQYFRRNPKGFRI